MSTTPLRRAPVAAISAAVLIACSSPPGAARSEVSATPRPFDGTIAVATTIDAKSCRDPRECAEGEAIRALLFMGVPGSTIPKPLVANEKEAKQAHREFFADLLDKKGFTKYVVRVDDGAVLSPEHPNEKRWNVVINSDALRRALESAGVIRKFGY